ncbi:iron-sulfur-binding ferredoxin reductase [Pseudomonas sp. UBA6562]|uniref:iron-sulfur-binding ferredoxin reductase n=1 Tax=Pseudomonas sp. UBA6562 TaxID=1947332 RepID=UPI0025D47102|nr:iron-sulfur-binding ferredoxin reductase [Pseudomonas sp. UBA6562]
MPELCAGTRRWSVPDGSNLLDALNQQGLNVPYSCRAGSCHACLVRCLEGAPDDARPDALSAAQRLHGWRLACQCRVSGDLRVAVFDPARDGQPAQVHSVDWLGDVLRLRLRLERALRYRAGQHLVLWLGPVARPYSLASLPGEDDGLEFHIDCRHSGAFRDRARGLKTGDWVGLGELSGGALHYDPDWQDRPLWLLAAGTGLAPLWGVAREALRQGHQAGITLLHVAHDAAGHYLAPTLRQTPGIDSVCVLHADLDAALANLRPASRQTLALLCGAPTFVERLARRLFIAGVPRNQVLADSFVEHA